MWEQIRSNKRKSAGLVVLVALLLFALGYAIGEAAAPGAGPFGLLAAGVLWVILSLTAYFQGDTILLGASGARRVGKQDQLRLFNVVEEMSIASGLPKLPEVYVMDDPALNAFATGRNPERASVAVTAGLLERLNRDQLQGVVAHEMSHVVNRDVLFMTLVGVMVGTIVMISDFFVRGMFRTSRYGHRRSSRGGGNAIMLVVALVLAILAPILARLIYLAASRRREYLADANAVVLTRYPEGLASALETIAGNPTPLASANRATAPMFIINPLRAHDGEGTSLLSTHPPTSERVRILRSMAGAASYTEYQRAWQSVEGPKAGHLPASALAAAPGSAIRAPHPEPQPPQTDRLEQRREVGDFLRRKADYAFIECPCGLKLKLPPDFSGGELECPRCHRHLPVSHR